MKLTDPATYVIMASLHHCAAIKRQNAVNTGGNRLPAIPEVKEKKTGSRKEA